MMRLALLFLILVLAAPSVAAQEVLRIAAVVNDEAISALDLDQRLRLFLANAQIPDRPEARRLWRTRVLRILVDERLKLQEAARLGISVTDREIERTMRSIEAQSGWGGGGIDKFLLRQGLERSVMDGEIRAQLAWDKIMGMRLLPTIFVGDDEVDAAIERLLENEGRSESNVLEIFLSVDTPEQAQEVSRTADSLVEQLRNGARFEPLARQFSEGSTATQGGHLGWVQQGQLAPELDAAIIHLEVGAVSDPVRSAGGVYIIKIADRRSSSSDRASEAGLHLAQVIVPVSDTATAADLRRAEATAGSIAERIEGCEDIAAVGDEIGGAPGTGDLGTIAVRELPKHIADAVKDIDVGETSAPVSLDHGLHVFVVCDRIEPEDSGPDRDSIGNAIGQRRLTMMARRYLRDLRRDAFLDENRL